VHAAVAVLRGVACSLIDRIWRELGGATLDPALGASDALGAGLDAAEIGEAITGTEALETAAEILGGILLL
jgi:hypothetical protein